MPRERKRSIKLEQIAAQQAEDGGPSGEQASPPQRKKAKKGPVLQRASLGHNGRQSMSASQAASPGGRSPAQPSQQEEPADVSSLAAELQRARRTAQNYERNCLTSQCPVSEREADTPYACCRKLQPALQEAEKLQREVMRYMIFKYAFSPMEPVTRAELSKSILEGYQHQRTSKLTSHVIMMAQERFPVVFGMEMKELRIRPATRTVKGRGFATDRPNAEGPKCYVLRSLLPAHLRRDVTDDPKDDALKALAMICCGLIEVSDGSLEEGELWRYLEQLGIRQKVAHEQFGKPEDALKTLIQRRYLSQVKETSATEGMRLLYEMGDNARNEFATAGGVKKFIDTMFGDGQGTSGAGAA